jgi:hypothetical protein
MKEIWKDIEGYEGIYKVSSSGRIKTMSREIPYNHSLTGERHIRTTKEAIKKLSNCKGYNTVGLCKDGYCKSTRLCRVVAKAFIPNPENKPCVNHIDGNKKNDNVSNLEWCTYKENMKHAKENGLVNYKSGAENVSSIKVKCLETGKVFDTIKDAAKYAECNSGHLSRMLRNIYTNRTTLVYA